MSVLTIIQPLIAYVLAQLAKAEKVVGKEAANEVWDLLKRLGDIARDTIAGHLTIDEAEALGKQQLTLLGIALQSAISDEKVTAEQLPNDLTAGLENVFLGGLKFL